VRSEDIVRFRVACDDAAGRAAGLRSTRRSGSFRRPGLPAERQQEPGPECIACAADVAAAAKRQPQRAESIAVVQPRPTAEFSEQECDQPQYHAGQTDCPEPVDPPAPGSEQFVPSSGYIDQAVRSICSFERSGSVRSFQPVAEPGKIVESQLIAAVVLDAFGQREPVGCCGQFGEPQLEYRAI